MNTRGERLQACLDQMQVERLSATEFIRLHPEVSEDIVALLVTADRFRHAPLVAPSQQFRSAARSRMLNLISSDSPPPRRHAAPEWLRLLSWRRYGGAAALARVAAAVVALLFVFGVTAVAASEALPASPLYSTKLAVENLRLAIATSDAERVQLHLDMSEQRAAELSAVADSATPADLARVAGLYQEAVGAAVREATATRETANTVARVESTLTREEQQLKQTLARLSDATPARQSAVQQALGFLEQERTQLQQRAGEDSLNSSGHSGQPGAAEQPRRLQEPPPAVTPSLPVLATEEPLPAALPDMTPGPSAGEGSGYRDPRQKQGSVLDATPGPAPSTPGPTVVPAEETETVAAPIDSPTQDTLSVEELRRSGQPPADTPVATPAGGQPAPSDSTGAAGPGPQQNADATSGPSTSGGPMSAETPIETPVASPSPEVGPATQGADISPATGTSTPGPTPAPAPSAGTRSDGTNGSGGFPGGGSSGGRR